MKENGRVADSVMIQRDGVAWSCVPGYDEGGTWGKRMFGVLWLRGVWEE